MKNRYQKPELDYVPFGEHSDFLLTSAGQFDDKHAVQPESWNGLLS